MKRLIVVLAMAGCAHSTPQAPPDPQTEFDLAFSGGGLTATCDAQGCVAPELSVRLSGGELRGSIANQPVDLALAGARVTGAIGSEPVQLEVQPDSGATLVRGTFAGLLSELRLEDGAIQGKIGRCSYDLHGSGGAFSGNRTCGADASPVPTRLRIPPSLDARPATERAALLALLLAN